LQRIRDEANAARDNPTALQQRSDVMLGTAQQHLRQLEIGIQNDAAGAGAGPLALADSGVQKANEAIATGSVDLVKAIKDNASAFDNLNGILGGVMSAPGVTALLTGLPTAAAVLLKGALGGAAATAGGAAEAGTAGAVSAGAGSSLLFGGLGALALGIEANTFDAFVHNARLSESDIRNGTDRGGTGSLIKDINVNIGQVGHDPAAAFEAIKAQFVAAWTAALGGHSVPVGVGGNMAPR